VVTPLRLGRLLLGLVVARLVPADGPVVLLLDETLERRRGKRIAYKGRFRDAVRSRGPRVVTCEGVQWLVPAVLVPLPWCRRPGTPWVSLPVLTIPALSPATSAKLGRRHRTCIERAGTLARLARRWLPGRELVLVADGGFAVIRVVKSTPHVPDATEAEQAKTVFTNAFEDAEAEAVYASLKARYKVKYFDDRIAKVVAQPASAAN